MGSGTLDASPRTAPSGQQASVQQEVSGHSAADSSRHSAMSDEEYYEEEEGEEEYEEEEYEEEEEEEEEKTIPDERKSVRSAMSEGDGNFLKARQEAKKGELDEQLREYINEWRKQRSKEEEELKRLKEKQAK